MNIFLTGATGFVGGQLLNVLAKYHTLYVLYRDESKKEQLKNKLPHEQLHFIKGDITEPLLGLSEETIESLPHMDYFYHLAALVKFDEHLRSELFQINYEGTKHALHLAERISDHFLYVSTSYTVGQQETAKETLYSIEAPVNNPYEESKVKAEHLVISSSMNTSIFRPSIIIGDSRTGDADSKFTLYGFMKAVKVFKKKLDRANNKEVMRLFGQDDGTSNLVPVDYVITCLVAGLKAKDKTIYHITNGNPPFNYEILDMIKRYLNFTQLKVAPMSQANNMTAKEQILNRYIGVFAPYFKRSISFDDSNMVQLLGEQNKQPLTLTTDQLSFIIRTYLEKS